MKFQAAFITVLCLACFNACTSLPSHPLNRDSGYHGYTSHVARPVMELMYIDVELLSSWSRQSSDSYYVYPVEFNCQERQDVTAEWVEYASQIDSIDTVVFSWSNVTDEMLEPLFACRNLSRIYLDGLNLKFETIERFARMPNVNSIIATDTDYDRHKVQRLKMTFSDKEFVFK